MRRNGRESRRGAVRQTMRAKFNLAGEVRKARNRQLETRRTARFNLLPTRGNRKNELVLAGLPVRVAYLHWNTNRNSVVSERIFHPDLAYPRGNRCHLPRRVHSRDL